MLSASLVYRISALYLPCSEISKFVSSIFVKYYETRSVFYFISSCTVQFAEWECSAVSCGFAFWWRRWRGFRVWVILLSFGRLLPAFLPVAIPMCLPSGDWRVQLQPGRNCCVGSEFLSVLQLIVFSKKYAKKETHQIFLGGEIWVVYQKTISTGKAVYIFWYVAMPLGNKQVLSVSVKKSPAGLACSLSVKPGPELKPSALQQHILSLHCVNLPRVNWMLCLTLQVLSYQALVLHYWCAVEKAGRRSDFAGSHSCYCWWSSRKNRRKVNNLLSCKQNEET